MRLERRRDRAIMPLLLVAAILIAALQSFSTGAAQGEGEAKRLTIGTLADISTLHPIRVSDIPSRQVMRQVFDALVDIDYEGVPQPVIAREWEISDDGMTYTFHLRDNVLFHDGTPLTADDVAFSLEAILDPEVASPDRARFELIEQVNVIDDFTVEVVLNKPSAPFIVALDDARIMPRHVVEAVGHDQFGRNPVGSGPFAFVSWQPDDRVVLESFDGYFAGASPLDEVVIRPIPEVSVRVAELETGQVDLIIDIPPHSVESLQNHPNITVMQEPGANYHFWAFNETVEPLDDVRVRQALAKSLNVEAIVQIVASTIAVPAKGPLPPGGWAYNPDLEGLTYDPAAARELLQDAGLPDGFTLTLSIDQNEQRMQAAQLIQAMAGEVGVNVEIEVLEWGTLVDRIFSGNYESTIVWIPRVFEPNELLYTQFHTSGINGRNFTGHSNPEVDELLDRGLLVTDQAERAQIYQEAEELIVESATMAFLWHEYSLGAVRDHVTGFRPHPRTGMIYLHAPWGVTVDVDR